MFSFIRKIRENRKNLREELRFQEWEKRREQALQEYLATKALKEEWRKFQLYQIVPEDIRPPLLQQLWEQVVANWYYADPMSMFADYCFENNLRGLGQLVANCYERRKNLTLKDFISEDLKPNQVLGTVFNKMGYNEYPSHNGIYITIWESGDFRIRDFEENLWQPRQDYKVPSWDKIGDIIQHGFDN